MPASRGSPSTSQRLLPARVWLGMVLAVVGVSVALTRPGRDSDEGDDIPESAMRRRLALVEGWVELGDAALPELRTNLRSGEPRRQLDAALAATRLGPRAESLRAELLTCLDSESVPLREQALSALLAQPAGRDDLLPRLARTLRDPAFPVRSLAAQGLDRATPAELDAALARADDSTRDLLNLIRRKWDPQLTPATRAAVRERMHDPGLDDLLRGDCLELLIWHDAVTLDDVLFGLGQKGPELGGLALRQIEEWGPRAGEAAPMLIRLLQGGSPAAQAASLEALQWLGPAATPALPQIEQYLHADVCFSPVPAADLVHQLGGDTPRAAALLRRRLLGDIPGPDQPAALARLDPEQTREVIAILAARVTRHDPDLRNQLWLLKHFGPAAGPAAGSLRPLLGDRLDPCRLNAFEVCARLGPQAGPLLPELTAVLAEPLESAGVDGALQRAALQSLAGLQQAAATSAPQVLQALVRWERLAPEAVEGGRLDIAGLQTLLDIAPADKEVQALCTRWLEDTDLSRALLAARGLLLANTPGDQPELAARVRRLLSDPPLDDEQDAVLQEDLRLALLDTLSATTLPDPATVSLLWQWASDSGAPLPRRLHALQCLAESPPSAWPAATAQSLLQDIENWLAEPPGPYPGPSRLAPEGQLIRDRYKPAVRARVSVRHWLRHIRDQLSAAESR